MLGVMTVVEVLEMRVKVRVEELAVAAGVKEEEGGGGGGGVWHAGLYWSGVERMVAREAARPLLMVDDVARGGVLTGQGTGDRARDAEEGVAEGEGCGVKEGRGRDWRKAAVDVVKMDVDRVDVGGGVGRVVEEAKEAKGEAEGGGGGRAEAAASSSCSCSRRWGESPTCGCCWCW